MKSGEQNAQELKIKEEQQRKEREEEQSKERGMEGLEGGKAMADAAKEAGDAAFRNGNYQEAVDKYSDAIRDNAASGTNPKHVLFSNRCAAYAKLGNWDKSLEDALACITASPTFVKGWTRKGAALFEKGRYNDAAEAYREALRLEPENASAKQQLAKTIKKKHDELREKHKEMDEQQRKVALEREEQLVALREEQQRWEREEHDVASQVLFVISCISMICGSHFF